MNNPITVMIPIGPYAHNLRWVQQAIDSVAQQSMPPDELLLVFDGNPDGSRVPRKVNLHIPPQIKKTLYHIPWRSGVTNAFNTGVAVARNDLVIMLGSDDMLLPDAVRHAWETWRYYHDYHGYYYFKVKYSTGYEQNVPCNAAMVHRKLWELTGGFPLEGAIGACDTMLISKMIAANGKLGNLYSINAAESTCDYWYRAHQETDTIARAKWYDVITRVREILSIEAAQL